MILLDRTFDLFGIALNAINKDWSDEEEAYYQEVLII
jgi:hypothetical protein